MQDTAPIGIIGLGLIGAAVCERLIDAGMPLLGFDIDPARCESLEANGGLVAASVRELANQSRVVIVAVYSGTQAEALLDDIEDGAGGLPTTMICMTTCAPHEIARLSERTVNAGIALIEAPVSGTSAELRDGRAVMLLGAEPALVESLGTLLDILCPRRLRVGAVGDASRTSLRSTWSCRPTGLRSPRVLPSPKSWGSMDAPSWRQRAPPLPTRASWIPKVKKC